MKTPARSAPVAPPASPPIASVDPFEHIGDLIACMEGEPPKPPPPPIVPFRVDLRGLDAPKGIHTSGDLPISSESRRFCSDRLINPSNGGRLIASVDPRRVTIHLESRGSKRTSGINPFRDHAKEGRRYNGYMSPTTRRSVKRIISTWIRCILHYRKHHKRRWDPGRAYPVFLTLTLPSPQIHTDQEINRQILQPFLIHLRRHHGIELYFWRAEAQINGNVHYHVITDRYIRAEDLQADWNRATNKLGYEDRYYESTGKCSPPSTHVFRVTDRVKDKRTGKWKAVDPVDYLVDYALDVPAEIDDTAHNAPADQARRKHIGRQRMEDGSVITYETRPIEGRIWGMSDALRVIREPRVEVSLRLIHALQSAVDRGTVRRVDTEYATLYFGSVAGAIRDRAPTLWRIVEEYYTRIFAYLYPAQLPPQLLRQHGDLPPVDLWIDPLLGSCITVPRYDCSSPPFASFGDLLAWTKTNRPAHHRQLVTINAA